jgi:N-acetylmuramoyl-L-alanine amidase
VIGRDGSVSQLVPFDVGTFHAGRAARDGLSINASSIGIELENWGRLTKNGDSWQRFGGARLPEIEVFRAAERWAGVFLLGGDLTVAD